MTAAAPPVPERWEEELASLPPREYLACFDVEFYLQDALRQFLLRRQSGGGQPAHHFMGQYLDAVLRGEHVVGRDFAYAGATPLNRRALALRLRAALEGAVGSWGAWSTALTAGDFLYLIAQVCPDFPADIVKEAAEHAEPADPEEHRALGELAPRSAGERAAACEFRSAALDAEGQPLLVFGSLRRLVELQLVHPELLRALRQAFGRGEAGHRRGALEDLHDQFSGGSPRSPLRSEERWPRAALARALEGQLAAQRRADPHGLRRILRRLKQPREVGDPCELMGFSEALAAIAEGFELRPAYQPADIAAVAGGAPVPHEGPVAARGADRGAKEVPAASAMSGSQRSQRPSSAAGARRGGAVTRARSLGRV